MREARNDGAPSCYASKMHSASSRLAVSSQPPINSPQSALASLPETGVMKNSAPLGLPPPTYESRSRLIKAEGLSAISASHTYHLCGSISSAALREKSDNQGQHWVSIKK